MSDFKYDFQEFHKNLLEWFQKHKRELPFRIHPTPYKIWISEVMLQQTRVQTMIPNYNQFLIRFPDIESVANSSEEEVLKYWRGLGYYSRAKNLRKACEYILKKHQGKFPNNLKEALKIPGVGPYTAKAVLSIGYNEPYAVLDGNVKRVISRFFREKDSKKWEGLATLFLNKKNPGDHNQAMMELGALVCLPVPQCQSCPLKLGCQANIEGKISEYPPPKKYKDKLNLEIHFYILHKEDKILLIKDLNRRFFKTIYSLPYRIQTTGINLKFNKSYSNPNYIQKMLTLENFQPLPHVFHHSITHHSLHASFYVPKKSFSHWELFSSLDTKWTTWKQLDHDFPSSIAKKFLKLYNENDLFNKL